MTEIERRYQPSAIERQEHWEQSAKRLVDRYAGFALAEDLSDAEKLLSVLSLVPMALEIVGEARDTIERLNNEIEELRRGVSGAN